MQTRNITLDWFKILLSIFVVCIHMPPLFKKGDILSWYFGSGGIPTIAVPIFFIINGYFFAKNILYKKNETLKYFFRVSMMYILWSIIYLTLYYQYTPFEYIILYLASGYFHLWYLSALLAGGILFYCITRVSNNLTTTFILSFALYIILKFSQDYKIDIRLLQHIYAFSSNISIGFFFFSLGALTYEKSKHHHFNKRTITYIASVIVLIFCLPIQIYTISSFTDKITYILILPCVSFIIFFVIIQLSSFQEVHGYQKYLTNISAGIYFTHIYVIKKIETVFLKEEYNIMILPFIIITCCLLSILLIFLNKKAKYLL